MLFVRSKAARLIGGVLETASFLSVKLALTKPHALRLFPGRVFRTYAALKGGYGWRTADVRDVINVPEGTRITLEHRRGHGIESQIDELAYLALITASKQPKNIFEIGTFRGRTALNFAINSPADCTVYTLDLPPENRSDGIAVASDDDVKLINISSPDADYRGSEVSSKIKQLYGNSLTFDFSPYFGKMDIVFVDGAHHYEAVKSDTINAQKMIRPGGTIIWHDFAVYGDYNDVTRAILDLVPRDKVTQLDTTTLAVCLS